MFSTAPTISLVFTCDTRARTRDLYQEKTNIEASKRTRASLAIVPCPFLLPQKDRLNECSKIKDPYSYAVFRFHTVQGERNYACACVATENQALLRIFLFS